MMKRLLSNAIALVLAAGLLCAATIAGYIDVVIRAAPGNPKTGNARLYVDSGTNLLACLLPTGSSCMPSGGGGGGGSGTVTSVGLTMPAEFSVGGSPITTSGAFTVAKAAQSANTVYAGPTSSSAAPTFRALVAGDLPVATSSAFGAVQPDNSTITISGGVISAVGAALPNFADNEVPSGTINGSNTAFTLAHSPTSGTLHLYLNGRRQAPTNDFTLSGSTITMINVPATGDTLLADYRY